MIEEEIFTNQDTPLINAHSKQQKPGKKANVLEANQPTPGTYRVGESGGSPLRIPIQPIDEIEEHIQNGTDTTNGAKEMMADTCTS